MNEIKIFESTEFGAVRTLDVNGQPWFVGKDVAEALGYSKTENAIANHVDDEDKTTTLIQGTGSNYKSNTVIINESGLYSLIMSSKLPTAKKFKHWVTSEVLPSIYKRGYYINPKLDKEEIPRQIYTLDSRLNEVWDQGKFEDQMDVNKFLLRRIMDLENEISKPSDKFEHNDPILCTPGFIEYGYDIDAWIDSVKWRFAGGRSDEEAYKKAIDSISVMMGYSERDWEELFDEYNCTDKRKIIEKDLYTKRKFMEAINHCRYLVTKDRETNRYYKMIYERNGEIRREYLY